MNVWYIRHTFVLRWSFLDTLETLGALVSSRQLCLKNNRLVNIKFIYHMFKYWEIRRIFGLQCTCTEHVPGFILSSVLIFYLHSSTISLNESILDQRCSYTYEVYSLLRSKWLIDVTFDWHHSMVMAVEHNNQILWLITFLCILLCFNLIKTTQILNKNDIKVKCKCQWWISFFLMLMEVWRQWVPCKANVAPSEKWNLFLK